MRGHDDAALRQAGRPVHGAWHRAGATVALRLLAVVPLLLGLSWLAPSALAAGGSGAISGEVSEVSTHTPIAGLAVCADSTTLLEEDSESINLEGDCAKTGANGEYTISGLPGGEYVVRFGGLFGGGPNYVTQYYEGKQLLSEAGVSVSAGGTASGIDAQLEQGGEIAGIVTNASTGAPIDGILVCAFGPLGLLADEQLSCATSNASGEYLISGLLSGGFDVGFFGEGYVEQIYDGKSSVTEANLVAVTVKDVTSGIDASLQSGGSSLLSPSASSPPGSPAGPGRALPGVLGQATLALLGSRITVTRGGYALVKLACNSATSCRGKLALKDERTVTVKHGKRLRTIAIGTSAAVSIAAGKKATARIKLDSAGRSLLRAHHGHLAVNLALLTAQRTRVESVVLIEQKARSKR